ncbi:MAG TPA: hypothetical protein VK661_04130, partial [Planctomycetota bacterium]|nr:hypothetical protein [Planctomycetota bacterium]
MRKTALILGIAIAFAGPATGTGDESLVVKAGRIITVSGEDITDGVIVIRAGKIEAVGKGIEVRWDAKVLDATKQVVMPGFVEAHT